MDLLSLGAIPWNELRDAYGSAGSAPKWIRDLSDRDEDVRHEAINEFLYSSVFHQYDLYSATPFTIPFILQLMKNSEITHLPNGLDQTMMRDFVHFVRICAESEDRILDGLHPDSRTIRDVVTDGSEQYQLLTAHNDPRVVSDANWLIEYCNENTGE